MTVASSGSSSPTSTITRMTSSTQTTLPTPTSSRLLLAEVVRVSEEGDTEFSGGSRVVGLGVCEDSVASLDEGGDEELAKVSKVDDDNLEALGTAKLMGKLGLVGSINGAHVEGFVEVEVEEGGLDLEGNGRLEGRRESWLRR